MKGNESMENCELDSFESSTLVDTENILCVHCKRTLENDIRCIGACVADSEY